MLFCILLVCLAGSAVGERKELIMLEIQELGDQAQDTVKVVSKRSPQAPHYAGQPQFQIYTGPQNQQIPGEYLSLLQGLQAQQGITGQQVNPNDIQQVLISRTPQQFTGISSQPQAAPRLSPQREEQRRLQEIVQQRALREQEARDTQRQQLREFYQQQGVSLPGIGAYRLQVQPSALQYFQQQNQQLVGQPSQAYYTVGQQTEPEQVSYAQVQLGDSKQTVSSQHRETAQNQQHRVVFTQPPRQIVYQVQRPAPTTEAPQVLPQQYLIETTKPQPPRTRQPFVYFRPQTNYREALAQQQYNEQQEEATSSPPSVPSRSSIYVSKATLGFQKQPFLNHGRVATPQGQRPLTPIELKALADAGFKVGGPNDESDDYFTTAYTSSPQAAFQRPLSLKRQNKRVPKPVPLSAQERQRLAQQGIRNLYKVETAETQDSPATYVLALGKPKTNSS